MGLVDEDELPPLSEELEDPDDPDQELSPRQDRLARLAGPALLEALGSGPRERRRCCWRSPRRIPETRYAIGPEMIEILATQTGRRFDPELQPHLSARARGRVRRARRGAGSGSRSRAGASPSVRGRRRRQLPRPRDCSMRSMTRAGSRPARSPTASSPAKGPRSCCSRRLAAAARERARPLARITGVGRAHEAGHLYSERATSRRTGWRRRSARCSRRARRRPRTGPRGALRLRRAQRRELLGQGVGCGADPLRDAFARAAAGRSTPPTGMGDAGAALGLIMLGLGGAGSVARPRSRVSAWSGAEPITASAARRCCRDERAAWYR